MAELFRLARKPRKLTPFELAIADDHGPYATINQSICAYDSAAGRLIIAETMSSAFESSLVIREGDTAYQIRSDHVGSFLSRHMDELVAHVPPSWRSCEVYVSDEQSWQSLVVLDDGKVLRVKGNDRGIDGSDRTTAHVILSLATESDHAITVQYWPAAAQQYSLTTCIDSVIHALITMGWITPGAIHVEAETKEIVPESISLDDAVARTLEVARELIGARPVGTDGRGDAQQLIQQLLQDPWDQDRPSWLVRNYHPDVDQMVQMRQGTPAVAILVAEHFVTGACLVTQGTPQSVELHNDVAGFADAVTCYLRGHVGEQARNGQRLTSRVCNLIHEWATRETRRPYPSRMAVDARNLSSHALDRIDQLVALSPWLEYFIDYRPRARHVQVVLSDADLVKTLALVRPRTTYIRAAMKQGSVLYREKFVDIGLLALSRSYLMPDSIIETSSEYPWLFNDLARACERLFFTPMEARRAVQVLEPIPYIAEVVDRFAFDAQQGQSSITDLTALVDRPPRSTPRVVLVNSNRTSRVFAHLCGSAVELAEFAPDTDRAVKYVTSPLVLADLGDDTIASLQVGDQERSIDISARSSVAGGSMCSTQWIDPNLFRGRRDQLIRMSGAIRADLGLRPSIAIFGPRRAGKTTLAVYSCRQSMAAGYLSGFAILDMYNDIDGTRPDGYAERWAAALVDRVRAAVEIEVRGSCSDPIDALREIDVALTGRSPFGIVLDEFDTLLTAPPGSEFRRLTARLGGIRWKNLAIIATVQRFHRAAGDLETWELVECREDLTWRDAVTYFCPPIERCTTESLESIDLEAPVVLPGLVRDVVVERIGYRPYFWGQLRSQFENYFVAEDGYAAIDRDLIDHIIDNLVTADPFLVMALQSTEGMPIEECRRRDLFSAGERRVLAAFARSGRKSMLIADAEAIAGIEATSELIDRTYMRRVGTQLVPAVPIFGEFLSVHAADFQIE